MENKALDFIDKLIDCLKNDWESHREHYLTVLLPSIVRSDDSQPLTGREQKIVAALHRFLSEVEWQRLPTLIEQRRAGNLRELASDRERTEQQMRRIAVEEARIARKGALVARLRTRIESDYLSAGKLRDSDPDAGLVTDEEYDKLRTEFVRDWVSCNIRWPWPLDSEQVSAVAACGGDIKVVARAGSGKTTTLVTRAIFLHKHCRVTPRAILLLVAFNKKAAEEMKGKLAEKLGKDVPHVMTFHALAHALVHPEETLLFDDPSNDQFELSRLVQELIDDHTRSKEFEERFRGLMLAHFREDWERIVGGRFQLTMEEFLEHRRALPRESLKGDYVKSFGEKVIKSENFGRRTRTGRFLSSHQRT